MAGGAHSCAGCPQAGGANQFGLPSSLLIFLEGWRLWLATWVFADEEMERLREFLERGWGGLLRHFTLNSADHAFVDPGGDTAPPTGSDSR
jgi:hypothetical protein